MNIDIVNGVFHRIHAFLLRRLEIVDWSFPSAKEPKHRADKTPIWYLAASQI
jgi:hypothetical protein